MTEKVSFRVGQMVRLEFSFLNQANSCMSSMMLTTMVALQSLQLQTAKGSSQEVPKDRFVFGESQNKLRLCKSPSKNIEAEFGQSE